MRIEPPPSLRVRRGDQPGGHGRGRAAGGAAGRAPRRPGVAGDAERRRLGERPERQLGQVASSPRRPPRPRAAGGPPRRPAARPAPGCRCRARRGGRRPGRCPSPRPARRAAGRPRRARSPRRPPPPPRARRGTAARNAPSSGSSRAVRRRLHLQQLHGGHPPGAQQLPPAGDPGVRDVVLGQALVHVGTVRRRDDRGGPGAGRAVDGRPACGRRPGRSAPRPRVRGGRRHPSGQDGDARAARGRGTDRSG